MAQLLLAMKHLEVAKNWYHAINPLLKKNNLLHHDLCVYSPDEALDKVQFAIVDKPEHGLLARMPNLKAIISIWAGVDHLVSDPTFPLHIPLYKMIEPSLNQGMIQYCLGHTLYYHLLTDLHQKKQTEKQWSTLMPPLMSKRKIGVMGLGTLGSQLAITLANLGFQVSGWSKTKKQINHITCFYGDSMRDDFLSRNEIVILLLPSNSKTRHIINEQSLAIMPKNSIIINAGRGDLIDDQALLHGLNTNHLRGATLDVFNTEPLPLDHPFWNHPNIIITPHIASTTNAQTGAEHVINIISAISNGKHYSIGLYKPLRGY